MDATPLVIDIESAPLPGVREFLDPPDLENMTPPGNYTKAESIAKWREEEKVKRVADFERDCTEKASLDFNCARIVAVGWWTIESGPITLVARDERDEADAIERFWAESRHRLIVGFSVREFDLPMLIQRSRYLGVDYRTPDLGRYSRNNGLIDLRDMLTFNDMRYDAVMPRSVRAFARRFGIPVDDDVRGADIPALVAAGEWDKVQSHCASDVHVEVQLGRRLGVIRSLAIA